MIFFIELLNLWTYEISVLSSLDSLSCCQAISCPYIACSQLISLKEYWEERIPSKMILCHTLGWVRGNASVWMDKDWMVSPTYLPAFISIGQYRGVWKKWKANRKAYKKSETIDICYLLPFLPSSLSPSLLPPSPLPHSLLFPNPLFLPLLPIPSLLPYPNPFSLLSPFFLLFPHPLLPSSSPPPIPSSSLLKESENVW